MGEAFHIRSKCDDMQDDYDSNDSNDSNDIYKSHDSNDSSSSSHDDDDDGSNEEHERTRRPRRQRHRHRHRYQHQRGQRADEALLREIQVALVRYYVTQVRIRQVLNVRIWHSNACSSAYILEC